MRNKIRMCSFVSIGILLFFQGTCENSALTGVPPAVKTNAASEISSTAAVSGGNVTNDGGVNVTTRGVCWSTSVKPTISGSKTTNGSGTGTFTSTITGLSSGTPYYIRAYATNSAGTGYGNQLSFTTNPGADAFARTRAGILGYLNDCIANNKIIVGQQVNGGTEVVSGYNSWVTGLKTLTGKTPALLGFEYGYVANMNYTLNNQYVINHWNAGGLVTINCSMDCPFLGGNYNCRYSAYDNAASIDLSKLLKDAPASAEKTSYRNELMAVGNALVALKNAGVIVLWRPFHEMNGTFFWWGANHWVNPTNVQAYKDLWIDMYNTYTTDLGLDNLIWVFSANAAISYVAPVTTMYPGSAYVDVVGSDIYRKPPLFAGTDYNALLALGKTIAVTENSPSAGGGLYENELQVLTAFKGKGAYFLHWAGWSGATQAIVEMPGATAAMNDASAITLENIPK